MRTSSVVALTLAFTVVATLGACSGTQRSSPFPETDDASVAPVPTDSSGNNGGFVPSGGDASTGTSGGCSDEAKLVYVVSAENDLYSFKPDALAFTKIGKLGCSAGAASPNSMAVDRQGTAWVNYSDGSLFKVSTKDASCTSTSFAPGQSDFEKFGMAFSSNAAGSSEETLFVAGLADPLFGGASGLAKIDLTSMKLTPIGDYSGALRGQGAELTGTGDAKLYGFYTTSPATLAEIEKASGATSGNKSLTGVSTGDAWAFSFWGGDFWFYTANNLQESSVTRYKKATDGSISVVMPKVGGFRIVGAGVSTCAPTTPPR